MGFSGANSRKNWTILQDFRRKKVKIRGTIGRFRGILAVKSQFSKDFQGQILRKIGQETISKKQLISLDFFLANFAKIDQFCINMTSVGERFF